MKKISSAVSVVLVLAVLICTFSSCSLVPFTRGEWKFSSVSSVSLKPELDDYVIDDLLEEYEVSDEAALETAALLKFQDEGVFEPCYLEFGGDLANSYDVIMERVATWAVYETSETEGFLSVYTELDVADGNPDPITNPVLTFDPDKNTLYMTMSYAAFMVTIEFVR